MSTTTKESELRRYLLAYPELNNAELAREAIGSGGSLSLYTEGSLKNYFGKMRKELQSESENRRGARVEPIMDYSTMSGPELRDLALTKLITEHPGYTVKQLVDLINDDGLVIGPLDIRSTYASSSLGTYISKLRKTVGTQPLSKSSAQENTDMEKYYTLDFSKCTTNQKKVAQRLLPKTTKHVLKTDTETLEELYGYGVEFYDHTGAKVNILFTDVPTKVAVDKDLVKGFKVEFTPPKVHRHRFYIFDESIENLDILKKGDHTSYRMLNSSYHLYDALLDAMNYVDANEKLEIAVYVNKHTPGTCNSVDIETMKFMIESTQENHNCDINLILPNECEKSLLDSFAGFKFKYITTITGEILV